MAQITIEFFFAYFYPVLFCCYLFHKRILDNKMSIGRRNVKFSDPGWKYFKSDPIKSQKWNDFFNEISLLKLRNSDLKIFKYFSFYFIFYFSFFSFYPFFLISFFSTFSGYAPVNRFSKIEFLKRKIRKLKSYVRQHHLYLWEEEIKTWLPILKTVLLLA